MTTVNVTKNITKNGTKGGIIVALDVTNEKDALDIAKGISQYVDYIKVGYPLVLATGLQIIGKLAEYAPVIADFKVADIPNTNRLICEQVFDAGAGGIIVHGFTGRDSLDACVDVAKEYGRDVYVVAEMSHPGAVMFFMDDASDIAKMAVDAGATGMVAPATRPDSIRKLRAIAGDMVIISPGVGAQGAGAKETIEAGADYIIVGRRIYEAKDPVAVVKEIVGELE